MIISKMKSNNTMPIMHLYLELLIYKIYPILIPFIAINIIYENNIVLIAYYIAYAYMYINLFITDIILRQSVKLRVVSNTYHNCDQCSTNIVWNLQDMMANIIFNIIGSFVFKYNIILDIYWRSYLHSLPHSIKNKYCIQKSLDIIIQSIGFGIMNYIVEMLLRYIIPFHNSMIIMLFTNFVFDCIIFNMDTMTNNINYMNIILKIVWKVSQFITVGYIEIKKREIANRDIIQEIISMIYFIRKHIMPTIGKIILWEEFQSLDNFISKGQVSLLYREHIISVYDLLVNINNYINNKIVKMVRKSKILHITSIFKPLLPSEFKFYIRIFESRRSIEPFINIFLKDIEQSIKNTKSEIAYEELFSSNELIEEAKIIDSYY